VLAAVSPVANVLHDLLDRENAALVRQAIQDLGNDRDRQILLRFYIAEEDKDRIAADYGLTSLQFNRVLHRARQRYRELLLDRLGSREAVAGAILLLLITLWKGMKAAS
jgi:DNA-directed RNA polymerase specialized sigma24 family protein